MTTPTKLAEDSPEDKYKAMIVTPDGTIIRIGGPEMKPETDPGWEERQAQRKAKRARERRLRARRVIALPKARLEKPSHRRGYRKSANKCA